MELIIAILMGLAGVLLICLVGFRHRWLIVPMSVALLLRIVTALVHTFIYSFPQGGSDAKVFMQVARDWSGAGCVGSFAYFDPSESYVYSSMLASLFSCLGYSELGAQFLNAALGTLSVGMLALAAERMWGRRMAQRAAFVLALFPALLVYSAVTLREATILAAFSMAAYAIVRYSERQRWMWFVSAVVMFCIAALFHGAMIFGAMGLIFAIALRGLAGRGGSKRTRLQRFLLTSVAIVGFTGIALVFLDSFFIPKIGNLGDLDTELVASVVTSRAQGSAAYLTGLNVSSPLDILWQAPIRMAYLLFAPFPWNVSSFSHLFGLIDGTLYFIFTVLFVRHRRFLMSQPAVFLLLTVCLSLALVYSFGTSNFGTGMRHRAKFYVLMIVIIAPVLSRWKKVKGEIGQ